MHGGEIDEGYCIVSGDALEDSMTPTPDSKKNSEEYFKGVDQVTELNDGYSFHFPAKSKPVEKLVELITDEKKDNPSVKFELIFQQDEMVLQIKGDVAKDFVKSWAPSWVLESPHLS
jgi:hypothetical protein